MVWLWRVEPKMAAVATVAYKYLVLNYCTRAGKIMMNPKTCVRRGTTQNSFSRKDMMMILVNTVGSYCSAQNAQQYVTLPFLLVS